MRYTGVALKLNREILECSRRYQFACASFYFQPYKHGSSILLYIPLPALRNEIFRTGLPVATISMKSSLAPLNDGFWIFQDYTF